MSQSPSDHAWSPLSPDERRVLGVLIEKQKTTPEYYPMTVNAIVTGCNQKSNRDPVTAYEPDDVEETLQELRGKGVAVMVDTGGRTLKWKHRAYDWLGLNGRPAEMAVIAELLLRGPQTEGELRQRASRMDEIADLPTLQTILAYLNELGLVVYLTPPGQKRGVLVCHGLYPANELQRIRDSVGHAAAAADAAEPRAAASTELRNEVSRLREDLAEVRKQLAALAEAFTELKNSLGA
jgi:uncharacterized protein YceH (UPF0502 family)